MKHLRVVLAMVSDCQKTNQLPIAEKNFRVLNFIVCYVTKNYAISLSRGCPVLHFESGVGPGAEVGPLRHLDFFK